MLGEHSQEDQELEDLVVYFKRLDRLELLEVLRGDEWGLWGGLLQSHRIRIRDTSQKHNRNSSHRVLVGHLREKRIRGQDRGGDSMEKVHLIRLDLEVEQRVSVGEQRVIVEHRVVRERRVERWETWPICWKQWERW
jgi:hypothetical protein